MGGRWWLILGRDLAHGHICTGLADALKIPYIYIYIYTGRDAPPVTAGFQAAQSECVSTTWLFGVWFQIIVFGLKEKMPWPRIKYGAP
jgi:hypothetical protein